MCNKEVRLFELTLPTRLAIEVDLLACKLNISRGEAISRAIQLLSLAVDADKVILTKDNKTTNVIVK